MSLTSTVVNLTTIPPRTVDLLAQTTDVNTTGVRSWLGDNVVVTILVLIACAVLMGGLRGNLSKVFTVGGLALVGLAFFGIAQSDTAATGIGNWLLSLFGVQV
jgi:membrane-bound ClpP family serine protease